MKVLIIEGHGAVSKCLAKKFLKKGHEVHLLGYDCGKSDYIIHDIKIEDSDFENLVNKELFDIIIDASKINNEKKAFDINVKGIEKIIKTSKNNKVILLSSTDIYREEPYIDEESRSIPKTAYGISMLAYEEYYNVYREIYNVDLGILRISNIYGSDLSNMDKDLKEIVEDFIDKKELSATLMENSKDYICIKDVVEGIYKAAFRTGSYMYNLSYGKSYSGKEIFEILNVIEFSHKYSRDNIEKKSEISNSLAINELGWKPEIYLEEGIYFLINSLKSKDVSKKKFGKKFIIFLIINVIIFLGLYFLSSFINLDYEVHILNLIMFLIVLFSSLLGVREGLITGVFASTVLISKVISGNFYSNVGINTCIVCIISNIIMYMATSLLIGLIMDKNKKEIQKAEKNYNTISDKLNFISRLYKED